VATEEPVSLSSRNGHAHCLLCGERNPRSLGLQFRAGDSGIVRSRFEGNLELQGYDNTLHGGVIAALLDAAMTHCLFHHSIQALTGDLHVRYLHPVPSDAALDISARIEYSKASLYRMQAEIRVSGRVMAVAEGKFMRRVESLCTHVVEPSA